MPYITGVPYIDNKRFNTLYVRNGKSLVHARTIDIMTREEAEKEINEPKGMANFYTIMNG